MQVTICGCGNAGIAMAADISFLGFDVNLFEMPEFEKNLEPMKALGGVELSGKTYSGKNGFAKLNKITSNVKEAIDGSDVIFLTLPAQHHRTFFEHLSAYLSKGQTVVATTGYWASLRLRAFIKEKGLDKKITFIEANIFPYLSGNIGPAKAKIFNYKRSMLISAFPADKNEEKCKVIQKIYPQYTVGKNVLETNLYPGNHSVHPQIALPNVVFFFERAREFRFYGELSHTAAKLADVFDEERIKVASYFDCDTTDYVTSINRNYEYKGKDLFELFLNKEHSERWGRVEGIYRVLIEDLCYFFVPMESLAKMAGIAVPITTAMIDIFKVVTGYDYRSNGITLKDLGIEGLSKEQILNYVNHGNV